MRHFAGLRAALPAEKRETSRDPSRDPLNSSNFAVRTVLVNHARLAQQAAAANCCIKGNLCAAVLVNCSHENFPAIFSWVWI